MFGKKLKIWKLKNCLFFLTIKKYRLTVPKSNPTISKEALLKLRASLYRLNQKKHLNDREKTLKEEILTKLKELN